MKHRVHLYVTVRVPIDGIEADNHQHAIMKALHTFYRRPDYWTATGEYADETTFALVDEEGDEEYLRSKSYNLTKGEPYPEESLG